MAEDLQNFSAYVIYNPNTHWSNLSCDTTHLSFGAKHWLTLVKMPWSIADLMKSEMGYHSYTFNEILRKNKPSQIKVNGIKNKIKFLQCRTNVYLYTRTMVGVQLQNQCFYFSFCCICAAHYTVATIYVQLYIVHCTVLYKEYSLVLIHG